MATHLPGCFIAQEPGRKTCHIHVEPKPAVTNWTPALFLMDILLC